MVLLLWIVLWVVLLLLLRWQTLGRDSGSGSGSDGVLCELPEVGTDQTEHRARVQMAIDVIHVLNEGRNINAAIWIVFVFAIEVVVTAFPVDSNRFVGRELVPILVFLLVITPSNDRHIQRDPETMPLEFL